MLKYLMFSSAVFLAACSNEIENLYAPVMTNNEFVIDNFDQENSLNWQIVDDNVMGGRSRGNFSFSDDSKITFSGSLSLANNGGFSSIRAYYPPDIADVKSIVIRFKGDGREYNFRIRTNNNSWASYSQSFQTNKGEWIEKELLIESFYPSYRGYYMRDLPKLSGQIIKEIGIMISDKKSGEFKIEVDWIKAK